MNAMKNLVHGVILALWGVMGAVLTLKVVFGGALLTGLLAAGGFWLWFAVLAALTSWVTSRVPGVGSVLAVHVLLLLLLNALPAGNLLRFGLDQLGKS